MHAVLERPRSCKRILGSFPLDVWRLYEVVWTTATTATGFSSESGLERSEVEMTTVPGHLISNWLLNAGFFKQESTRG